jgi:lipopolysaccharide export system ATP-binding protein
VDEHLLQAKGLRKRFGAREVVRGIDLEVRAGEIVGLLGKNGAGKTTSFRMVIGLLKFAAGTVSFRGKDVSQLPMYERARLGMGYLAQEPSIFSRMTVTDNIAAILELIDIPDAERAARLERLVAEFGLGKVRDSKAATLSGGERRRLEIARALATEPELLLFDEPFSGIDPIAVFEIQEVIYDLRAKGLGILLTDHNVRETLAITDRAYIMEEGAIWLEGAPAELVNHPDARRLYLGERFQLDVSEAKRATQKRSQDRLGRSGPDGAGDGPRADAQG